VNAPLIATDILPASRGRRAHTKAHNRRVILDAARQVFAELGYDQATVRDIVRATSLASGTFYNYFKSKEEVFEALRDATAATLRPQLREQRHQAVSGKEFIEGTFRTFFSFVAANRADFDAIMRNDLVPARVNTWEIIAGFDELHSDVKSAIDRGLLPKVDAVFLTAAIVGIAFQIAETMQKPDGPDADSASRFATALILGGTSNLTAQAKASG